MRTNKGTMKVAFTILSLFYLLSFSHALLGSKKIGINYGRLGSNLPSPFQSISYLQSLNIEHVKLYDASPEVLKLLSGTNIHVSITIPNHQISTIASNQSTSHTWVHDNVLAYYPNTNIRFILLGNDLFSSPTPQTTWLHLVPAMRNIKKSLKDHHIHNIKVGTPVAIDVLHSTFPPSAAKFRSDIPTQEVIVPLLTFLNGTNSFFFVNVYPYFMWSQNQTNVTLDFALLNQGNTTYMDPGSGLNYTNLLDEMVDSVAFAMGKLGFDGIRVAVAETGWPHEGDIDEAGATVNNAATYMCNLVEKMATDPPLGTPARPGVEIPTFVFSLYDENQKPGPGSQRHWGLLNSSGNPVYEMDLSNTCPDRVKAGFPKTEVPVNNKPYKGKIWCVAAKTERLSELAAALDLSCKRGNGTCDELAPGKNCYEPVTVASHASYAFSSYWAKFRSDGESCYFDGLAVETIVDPSHGSCKFPSVLV